MFLYLLTLAGCAPGDEEIAFDADQVKELRGACGVQFNPQIILDWAGRDGQISYGELRSVDKSTLKNFRDVIEGHGQTTDNSLRYQPIRDIDDENSSKSKSNQKQVVQKYKR